MEIQAASKHELAVSSCHAQIFADPHCPYLQMMEQEPPHQCGRKNDDGKSNQILLLDSIPAILGLYFSRKLVARFWHLAAARLRCPDFNHLS
mmetsp:Transcript_20814/g.49237  ORF Transcript_20814/g.49237 Transcript_20814/m.49237 type:complete len:92 (+) Transcript_20814:178-453(+)